MLAGGFDNTPDWKPEKQYEEVGADRQRDKSAFFQHCDYLDYSSEA